MFPTCGTLPMVPYPQIVVFPFSLEVYLYNEYAYHESYRLSKSPFLINGHISKDQAQTAINQGLF